MMKIDKDSDVEDVDGSCQLFLKKSENVNTTTVVSVAGWGHSGSWRLISMIKLGHFLFKFY